MRSYGLRGTFSHHISVFTARCISVSSCSRDTAPLGSARSIIGIGSSLLITSAARGAACCRSSCSIWLQRLCRRQLGARAGDPIIRPTILFVKWPSSSRCRPVRLTGTENRHKPVQNTRVRELVRIWHFNGLGFAELLCESPSFARTFAKKDGDIILRQNT